jgi:hypothetical protein
LKKKQAKKKPGKTRSKTRLQPVDFLFFLLKRRRFDFKKKIDPSDPVKIQNPDLGPDRV